MCIMLNLCRNPLAGLDVIPGSITQPALASARLAGSTRTYSGRWSPQKHKGRLGAGPTICRMRLLSVRKELRPERFMALERREKIEGGELQSVQKEQNANNLQNYQQCFKYHGHHLGWIAKELSLTICSIRLRPNAK